MSKSNPPRWRSTSSAISRYAIAVLSVGIAIVVAELLTVFLHTEPIASLMIAAVMFVAWFGGFGPGLLAIALAVLAIHYYVVPPSNSFALKNNLFSLGVAELFRQHRSVSRADGSRTKGRHSRCAAPEGVRHLTFKAEE